MATHIEPLDCLLTVVEKIVLFLAMLVSIMACQQVPDSGTLRGAHYDPAKYFDDDRLRANTLVACRAGTAKNQAEWSTLYACRTSASTDLAKHSGWKPSMDSTRTPVKSPSTK